MTGINTKTQWSSEPLLITTQNKNFTYLLIIQEALGQKRKSTPIYAHTKHTDMNNLTEMQFIESKLNGIREQLNIIEILSGT
jgi:hypothetical protein